MPTQIDFFRKPHKAPMGCCSLICFYTR